MIFSFFCDFFVVFFSVRHRRRHLAIRFPTNIEVCKTTRCQASRHWRAYTHARIIKPDRTSPVLSPSGRRLDSLAIVQIDADSVRAGRLPASGRETANVGVQEVKTGSGQKLR